MVKSRFGAVPRSEQRGLPPEGFFASVLHDASKANEAPSLLALRTVLAPIWRDRQSSAQQL